MNSGKLPAKKLSRDQYQGYWLKAGEFAAGGFSKILSRAEGIPPERKFRSYPSVPLIFNARHLFIVDLCLKCGILRLTN